MKTETIIYALGFFDGVHLGHRALLEECVRLAALRGAAAGAVTFVKHPQSLFSQEPPKLLTDLESRVALLRDWGMTQVKMLDVTEAVMGQHWRAFLESLVAEGAAGFVCGQDFRFGHRGEGNAQSLKAFCEERGLPCTLVEDRVLEGKRISSSYIRSLLEAGEVEEAARFLGRSYALSGTVVPGRGLGRTLGTPTANLAVSQEAVLPKRGVYACKARVGEKTYLAVTNIGTRPTVAGSHVTVEPWLLDFAGDLYGKTLTLSFHAYLRPERTFGSLEELRAEIQKNAAQARKIFEKT